MCGISLAVFGITAMEESLYRHFLRNPDTAPDDIHLRLHVEQDQAQEAVTRLSDLGVLRRTERGTIAPADPEVAVDRLTEARMAELYRQLQEVTRSRAVIADLRAEQGARTLPPQGVERMENVAEIRDRIDDLAFFAREEILSVEPYAALTPANIEHARPLDRRCLRRGVRVRSVVLKEALTDPLTVRYLLELAAQGAEIRVADDISERILVYDRRTALVPVDPADTSRGALVAQEEGLVANILALFEKIWNESTALTALVDGEVTGDGEGGLSEIEQQVLESMCKVGKDEIGARDLGISVRTYRRHVADLLKILDASSRAHAALLARERGWI
ncbi:helix-turn-helix transcriptional regulator [Streptomyces syringium]|uniref:helix-turn-helix transcriptional regulator n=1 Tax=Streptomyces syringium TaxID=76729 RepID=UPI0036587DC2